MSNRGFLALIKMTPQLIQSKSFSILFLELFAAFTEQTVVFLNEIFLLLKFQTICLHLLFKLLTSMINEISSRFTDSQITRFFVFDAVCTFRSIDNNDTVMIRFATAFIKKHDENISLDNLFSK